MFVCPSVCLSVRKHSNAWNSGRKTNNFELIANESMNYITSPLHVGKAQSQKKHRHRAKLNLATQISEIIWCKDTCPVNGTQNRTNGHKLRENKRKQSHNTHAVSNMDF